MSIELQVLNQIKKGFNLAHDEAEAALLLLTLRARNLDISFEQYIKTYHPKGLVQKDNSLNPEYKGYVQFLSDDAKSIIRVGKNADFSTFVHENAHVFRRQLSGKLKEQAEKAFKVQSGNWTEAQEEAFAIGFEEYVRLRLYGNEELKEVFEKGSVFMQKVYNGLDRIIELNPEIIKVYEQMFTEGRFQFDKSLFDKTIDNIANFKNEPSRFKSSHVYLGMTPPIYQELGFERLPVMITAKHLQNIMSEAGKDKNTNYHGLSADMVKQIPEAIKKPLLIMQSQNAANAEDVIAVIELKDKEGNPIIIPFSPNKKGRFNDILMDINLAKSVYGKEKFVNFLDKAIKENRILYINKKSQVLANLRIQYPNVQGSQLLYDNISKYQEDVNKNNPNFGKFYQNTAYYSGGQLSFDFLNDPVKVSQAVDKNIINTNKKEDEKLSGGVIFKTDKIKIIDNKELQRVQIFFPSIPDISVRDDFASVLGNLKPMEEVKAEIKRKNNTRDSEKNISFLDRLKEDKEYTKNYKSAIKSFLGNSFSIGNDEKRTSADKAVCMER